ITIGDWEAFVTRELVAYIDSHYRTLANRNSRGLAGHSMGGYGTIRLGMKNPDIYSSIYLLSACCMEGGVSTQPNIISQVESLKSLDELEKVNFQAKVAVAASGSWAPNPQNPPWYIDLPYENGKVLSEIDFKIMANRTLYSIDQYIPNLRKLKAIGLDAGTQDRGIHAATVKLHELLTSYGIPHEFESYEGNHTNRISDRIRYKVLPFFSEHLEFE
ncbi:MAG: esterase, partial [Verrucomicrobiae bacterium]|nr:esterase [Verrucomicrobiae bacterium]